MTLSAKPVELVDGVMHRRVRLSPGMCGAGSLFFGRVGDWTWETVESACHTDVHNATNVEGNPSYLSFYYYSSQSLGALDPYGLTFGDELDVASRVFDLGSQSVLTVHRLSRAGTFGPCEPLGPTEVYEQPRRDCIYVENFNRWISRSKPGNNQRLVQAAPPEFQHAHLPRLPIEYSPRARAGRARENGTFHPDGIPGFHSIEKFTTTYELNVVHDLNGVGLLYFASYFSIIDTAIHRLWRKIGRSDRDFLSRRLLHHQLGYFGNADLGSVFTITVNLWGNPASGLHEIADVAVRDRDTGSLLSVAAVETTLDSSK